MAKVLTFKADYGMSIQIKEIWHKMSCSMEVEIEPKDELALVKERTWNSVIIEVEKQFKDILDNS